MSPADVSVTKRRKKGVSLVEHNTSGKQDSTRSNTCSTDPTLGNSNYSATDDDYLGFNLGTSLDDSFLSLGTPSYGSVCYRPPKLKNWTSLLENGGSGSGSVSQSTSNGYRQSNDQMSCSSPPDLALSMSIIRKRTQRKTVGLESWLHRYQPSLGRRLDYMFNEE
ncbi:hypothetical protein Hanom_Chr06g00480021 [Helianthus anomalus]